MRYPVPVHERQALDSNEIAGKRCNQRLTTYLHRLTDEVNYISQGAPVGVVAWSQVWHDHEC